MKRAKQKKSVLQGQSQDQNHNLTQTQIQGQEQDPGKDAADLLHEYCEHHKHRPRSRRDFLSAGLIGFSGSLFLGSLPQIVRAQQGARPLNCHDGAGDSLPAFVTLNLAGGAMLGSHFLPMDAGGQPLSSYNDMGSGTPSALSITREFGNVPFRGDSTLLAGIKSTASAATIENTSFVGVNVRSRDDSGNNPFDVSGMVAKAGLVGELLPNLGVRDGNTGIRQRYSKIKPPNPLIVSRFGDLQGAVGAPGALAELTANQRTSFFSLVDKLNSRQVANLANQNGGDSLENLIRCATTKNIQLSQSNTDGLDVRTQPGVSTIWGVNAGTNEGDREVLFGSMLVAALSGSCGTVGLEMGGYDYHNNTRTRGDAADNVAGQTIGRILETAAQMGKKLFLYVTTDGSCRSEKSDSINAPWKSDRGSAGVVYMITYDPGGRVSTRGFQLGHFTNGQAADESFLTGGNVELASAAVFCNYLNFSGQLQKREQVIPNLFSNSQLDQILKIG